MGRFRVEPEIAEDVRDHGLVVDQGVEGVLHFLARSLVGDEVELEGGHLAFREQRAALPKPQIPQHVAPAAAFFLVMAEERGAHVALHHVVERAAFVRFAVDVDFLERAVGVERHTGVEEQVAVVHLVEASRFQEELHVAAELLASGERGDEALHHVLFGGREGVGVLRVDGREHLVGELVLGAVEHHRAASVVDLVQKLAVAKAESRILVDELAFHLELDNRHRLLDLHVHLELGGGKVGVALEREPDARVVGVGVERERGERQNVDAVGVFQDGEVAVARAVAHHVRDATALAKRGTHPHDVMIAPLDVHRMVRHERVHDGVRRGAAVVNVADDMQLVHREALDHGRERFDERDTAARAHRRINDGAVVGFLVNTVAILGQKLLDDVGELAWHGAADFGVRVLAGGALADRDEARHRDGVPCVLVFHLR